MSRRPPHSPSLGKAILTPLNRCAGMQSSPALLAAPTKPFQFSRRCLSGPCGRGGREGREDPPHPGGGAAGAGAGGARAGMNELGGDSPSALPSSLPPVPLAPRHAGLLPPSASPSEE